MSAATDGNIDELVKARWLAIGLSQTDLAEVLGAAFQQNRQDDNGSNEIDAGRLMQLAEALGVPVDFFRSRPAGTGEQEPDLRSAEALGWLQSLFELRLLRAFHELQDHQTKYMLIHLTEQIVKRQTNRRGDAS